MNGALVVFLIFTIFAACSVMPPERNFSIKLWAAFPDSQTIERKNDQDEVEVIDTSSIEFGNYICITPEDYQKEREYQELLKKSCKTWR